MTREEFQVQIHRLAETYGKAAYPQERVKLFWASFSGVQAQVFQSAVDELIANHRMAPMHKEIDLAIEKARHGDISRTGELEHMNMLLKRGPITEEERSKVRQLVKTFSVKEIIATPRGRSLEAQRDWLERERKKEGRVG